MRWTLVTSLLCTLLVAGCGRSSEEPVATTRPDLATLVVSAPLSQPLTVQELKAFLMVMKELPKFDPTLMADLQVSAEDAEATLEQLRQRLRGTLRTDVLADRWLSDPRARRTLKEFGVEAEAFASLTLRVSAAWSARVVAGSVKLAAVQRHVDSEIQNILRDLRSGGVALSQLDRQQLGDALGNCVALSEFLNLLQQVPADSLDAVARVDQDLRTVLPRDASATSFARQFSSKAEVLQAGWATQQ